LRREKEAEQTRHVASKIGAELLSSIASISVIRYRSFVFVTCFEELAKAKFEDVSLQIKYCVDGNGDVFIKNIYVNEILSVNIHF
jgi:hypothetical protein